MGRPKGSSNIPVVDPNNIIVTEHRRTDENDNSLQPPTPKTKPVVSKRSTPTNKTWHSLVGTPIHFFPKTKLPQNKALLRRFLAL